MGLSPRHVHRTGLFWGAPNEMMTLKPFLNAKCRTDAKRSRRSEAVFIVSLSPHLTKSGALPGSS